MRSSFGQLICALFLSVKCQVLVTPLQSSYSVSLHYEMLYLIEIIQNIQTLHEVFARSLSFY